MDFSKLTDLQAACEFTSKDIAINTELSEDNLYLYYDPAHKKMLPYHYGVDSVSVDCVNWLSTAISKTVTLAYGNLSKDISDGDTQLKCQLFGDINGNGQPVNLNSNVTIGGFSVKNASFKIPEAFLGFYVTSPSNSAQTSTTFSCDFPLSANIN